MSRRLGIAAVVLLFTSAASAVPGETSPGAASFSTCSLDPRALIHSWPPCIEVTLTGNGVTGLPPITATWQVSNGLRISGNPAVLHTEDLPPGQFSVALTVANAYGARTSVPIFFRVESLRFLAQPTWTNTGAGTVQFNANTEGATEYQWTWGDGVVSPWLLGCAGKHASHSYPSAGTYNARLKARNCREGTITSSNLVVTVTTQPQIDIVSFAAVCPLGSCIFNVGQAISFIHQITGTPTTFAYDWDGNGLTDQLSSTLVSSHTYTTPGLYTPRLTISRGTQVDSAAVPLPLVILDGGPLPNEIFSDGFETGDYSRWSLVVRSDEP